MHYLERQHCDVLLCVEELVERGVYYGGVEDLRAVPRRSIKMKLAALPRCGIRPFGGAAGTGDDGKCLNKRAIFGCLGVVLCPKGLV